MVPGCICNSKLLWLFTSSGRGGVEKRGKQITIREDPRDGIVLLGVREEPVESIAEMLGVRLCARVDLFVCMFSLRVAAAMMMCDAVSLEAVSLGEC